MSSPRFNMRNVILLATSILPLAACAPHPGAGKWAATGEKPAAIPALTLSYDGRALFTTQAPRTSWHCFWNAVSKSEVNLACTPSSNPDQAVQYLFRVNDSGQGELLRQGKVIGRFQRVAGKPEIS